MAVHLDEGIVLPKGAVRFPVELRPQPGMRLDDPATFPRVDGRLEYVAGRLLYMPPCADFQQDVAMDVAFVLRTWSESRPEFVVGGNEAGMLLGSEIRAADAAVWRRDDVGVRTGKVRRTPPVLAVEISGEDEGEPELRDKARWYLAHGVVVVWIALPHSREVLVIDAIAEARYGVDARLDERAELPGLSPDVASFFTQISR